jgi:hypothetical protein
MATIYIYSYRCVHSSASSFDLYLTYLGECLQHHELHLGRLIEALQPNRPPDSEPQCLGVAITCSTFIERHRLSLVKPLPTACRRLAPCAWGHDTLFSPRPCCAGPPHCRGGCLCTRAHELRDCRRTLPRHSGGFSAVHRTQPTCVVVRMA